jgi:Fe2+ transport system protein FeoA
MKPGEMYERLIPAEIAFAHFNALRTAAGEGHSGIRRGVHETLEYLVDPTRESSTYYNRAVGRSADSLSDSALRGLPATIVGLEITPGQLTHELAGRLLELGFQPAYQLCYLGLVPVPGTPVEREVIRLGPPEVDDFFDLLQLGGTEFPAEKRARKRGYYCTEQFRAYVSKTADGVVSGWSTMFVNGSVAFFGNSFTLPRFRKTGAHGALLAARLNDAAKTGIEVAFTDVEHGSQSHYNCERAGFRTLTINTIWEKRE